MGHLNINSIKNKLDALFHIVDDSVDVIFISDSSFFSHVPFRLHRNSKDGGNLLYICEDIPCMLLNVKSKSDIKTISLEIIREKGNDFKLFI